MMALSQAAKASSTPYILAGDNPIQIEKGPLQEYPAAWELPEVPAFLEGRDSGIEDVTCQGKGVRLISSPDVTWPDYFSELLIQVPQWGLEECYHDIGCEFSAAISASTPIAAFDDDAPHAQFTAGRRPILFSQGLRGPAREDEKLSEEEAGVGGKRGGGSGGRRQRPGS